MRFPEFKGGSHGQSVRNFGGSHGGSHVRIPKVGGVQYVTIPKVGGVRTPPTRAVAAPMLERVCKMMT